MLNEKSKILLSDNTMFSREKSIRNLSITSNYFNALCVLERHASVPSIILLQKTEVHDQWWDMFTIFFGLLFTVSRLFKAVICIKSTSAYFNDSSKSSLKKFPKNFIALGGIGKYQQFFSTDVIKSFISFILLDSEYDIGSSYIKFVQ